MSKGRGAPHYPNSGPHKNRYEDIISAQQLGESFSPNRQQRRDYVRINQNRQGRKYLVGFGRWRRHHDRADYPIQHPQIIQAPRRERRPAMIQRAKAARRLVRLAYRGR